MFGSDWPRSMSLVLTADTIRFNLGSFSNKVAVFWIWNWLKFMSQTWLCGLDIAHTIWTGACLAIWHVCACKKKKKHTNKKPLTYIFHIDSQLLGQHRPFLVVQMDWSPVCVHQQQQQQLSDILEAGMASPYSDLFLKRKCMHSAGKWKINLSFLI